MRHGIQLLRAAVAASILVCAAASQAETKSKPTADIKPTLSRIIMLVDYINGDYPEAVRGGKIVSEAEFQEMTDFSATAARLFGEIRASLDPEVQKDVEGNLASLKVVISNKADVAAVRALTDAVRGRLVEGTAIVASPDQRPQLAVAEKAYLAQCSTCHGATGHGDGPLATPRGAPAMEPPPRDFHETAVMEVSSPFKFFNIMTLGVEGTAMPAFEASLTENERWSLGYYLAGLRHGEGKDTPKGDAKARWSSLTKAQRDSLLKQGLSLELLAKSSDNALLAWLDGQKAALDIKSPSDASRILAVLRLAAPYVDDVPLKNAVPAKTGDAGITPPGNGGGKVSPEAAAAGVSYASKKVEEARKLFAATDYAGADAALLDGYLQGYERAEILLSVRDGDLVVAVERLFISSRAAARSQDQSRFAQQADELTAELTRSQQRIASLTENNGDGGSVVDDAIASFIIIVREGFEAFLVIAALLAMLKNLGAPALTRWVHAGWISAIVCGVATFFVVTTLVQISGATQEIVEGGASLLAAAMLFYVGFFMLSQKERTKWERYIREGVKSAVNSRKTLTLFFLAFIAVYREAAETVLFYQALISSADSNVAVLGGLSAGVLVIGAMSWAIVKLGLRLPLKQFFAVTSASLIAIALVLVGKGTNELIEAGIFEPTIVSVPRVDILGIYPSAETLTAQAITAVLALSLWGMSRRSSTAS